MGGKLLQIISQVGIFMICAQMILHFKPSESYGKYIKLLISIMVLVQLFLPAMEIFGGRGNGSFQTKIGFYADILDESMEEVNITSVTAEKMLEELTMEEIKSRINNQNTADEGEKTQKEEAAGEDAKGEGNIQIDRIEVGVSD